MRATPLRLLLAVTVLAVWHFIAHADHVDPELAHVLLALANGILLAGVIAAIASARRGTPPE